MTIKWLREIDSTNNEAKRRLSELDNMSVIAARHQTAGRGSRGSRWESLPGENLTFSLLLRPGHDGIPAVAAKEQFVLTMAATLAVASVLEDNGLRPMIKWPNDIYVDDRKICGMLIENGLNGTDVATSIMGIGINVNQTAFAPELPNPVSMASAAGRSFVTDEILAGFLSRCSETLGMMSAPETLRREYLSRLYRFGTEHPYMDCASEEIFQGTIIDVLPSGLLVIRCSDGTVNSFSFKEISFII